MPINKMMQNIDSNRFTPPFFLVLAVFVIRLLPIRQELPPYPFCDEEIFSNAALQLIISNSWITSEFRAGGINIYPTVVVGKLLQYLGYEITLTTTMVIGRIIGPLIFGSLTIFLVYLITLEISKNRQIAILSGIFFLFSPAVYAYGRIAYPDHYIYFFSGAFLYYLLKATQDSSRTRYFLILGILLGIVASVKYTGVLLVAPLILVFLVEINRHHRDPAKLAALFFRLTAAAISSVVTFFTINFSALFDPNAFIFDFRYNIENYESFQRSPLITSGYYFFVSYVLLFGFFGVLAVIAGYNNLWQRNRHLLFIFASFPILLSIYLSTGGLVLNRITSITIPFISPVMAIGAYSIFSHLSLKLGNKVAVACALIFFAQPTYSFGISVLHDLKQDSRLLATPWLLENIPEQVVIGVNGSCSGLFPPLSAGFQTQRDPFLDQKLEYYVFVHYWGTPFDDFYRKNDGVAQVVDQKYLHFDHFNDTTFFRFSKPRLTLMDLSPPGYKIIKVFSSNGPDVIVIERID